MITKTKETETRAVVAVKRGSPAVLIPIKLRFPPGPQQVLVRMEASGICHSDLLMLRDVCPIRMPLILGHEGAGIVEAVGEGVRELVPGDRVALLGRPSCGRCHVCLSGKQTTCEMAMAGLPINVGVVTDPPGLDPLGILGTLSERMVVPEWSAFNAGPDIPVEVRALYGCLLTTAYGAVVVNGNMQAGSVVLVIGAGGIGLAVAMFAKACGATTVVVTDRRLGCEKIALDVGADRFIWLTETDPKAARDELADAFPPQFFPIITGPFDIVFECTGSEFGQQLSTYVMNATGTTVFVGVSPWYSATSMPLSMVTIFEQKLITIHGSGTNHRRAAEMITRMYRAGMLPVEKLVSEKRYSLEQINEAFDDMAKGLVIGRALVMLPSAPKM